MQRVELTDLAKSLRLEFSDSSEAYVSRSGEDYFIFSLDLGGTTYKFIHQRMGERISGFFPSFSSEHSILKMLKHNSLRRKNARIVLLGCYFRSFRDEKLFLWK